MQMEKAEVLGSRAASLASLSQPDPLHSPGTAWPAPCPPFQHSPPHFSTGSFVSFPTLCLAWPAAPRNPSSPSGVVRSSLCSDTSTTSPLGCRCCRARGKPGAQGHLRPRHPLLAQHSPPSRGFPQRQVVRGVLSFQAHSPQPPGRRCCTCPLGAGSYGTHTHSPPHKN